MKIISFHIIPLCKNLIYYILFHLLLFSIIIIQINYYDYYNFWLLKIKMRYFFINYKLFLFRWYYFFYFFYNYFYSIYIRFLKIVLFTSFFYNRISFTISNFFIKNIKVYFILNLESFLFFAYVFAF